MMMSEGSVSLRAQTFFVNKGNMGIVFLWDFKLKVDYN